MRDLLNHVCSSAEKTTINDAVAYFTSQANKMHSKSVLSDTCSADDKMVRNIAGNTAMVGDTSSAGQNTGAKDSLSDGGCGDKEVDVSFNQSAEVAAVDVSESVGEASVRSQCRWKLLMKVHIRNKNIPHRYAVTFIDYWTVCQIYHQGWKKLF